MRLFVSYSSLINATLRSARLEIGTGPSSRKRDLFPSAPDSEEPLDGAVHVTDSVLVEIGGAARI